MESHATSAAAFVEGGIQDACDDSCSICLEAFCDSDPSTVPEELTMPHVLAVHRLEGSYQLPVGAEDADLEERIIQHLAAAAAMGRTYRIHRREGNCGRPADHGRAQHMVYSRRQSAPPAVSSSPSSADGGEDESVPVINTLNPSAPIASGTNFANSPGLSNNRNSSGQPTPGSQDRAGPSDFQSFSDSFKSRLNAVSMRYKESITKSTRGWKEKLFSRNSAISDLGSEVKREINAGIATVSRMMERLETRDGTGPSINSGPSSIQDPSATETSRERITPSSGPTTAVISDSTPSASGLK